MHKAQHVRSETRPYPTISMIVYRTRVNLLLHNQLMQASQIVILYSYRKPFHVLHWRCATAWHRVRDGDDVWLAGAPVGRREAAGGQCGREVELSCGRVVRRAKKREAGQGGAHLRAAAGVLLAVVQAWCFCPSAKAAWSRVSRRTPRGEERTKVPLRSSHGGLKECGWHAVSKDSSHCPFLLHFAASSLAMVFQLVLERSVPLPRGPEPSLRPARLDHRSSLRRSALRWARAGWPCSTVPRATLRPSACWTRWRSTRRWARTRLRLPPTQPRSR